MSHKGLLFRAFTVAMTQIYEYMFMVSQKIITKIALLMNFSTFLSTSALEMSDYSVKPLSATVMSYALENCLDILCYSQRRVWSSGIVQDSGALDREFEPR